MSHGRPRSPRGREESTDAADEKGHDATVASTKVRP